MDLGLINHATDFVEKIIILSDNNISIKVFDNFIYQIKKNEENLLNKLITRWLLSKKIALCHCATDLLQSISIGDDDIISVDYSQLNEQPKDVHLFLAKKACGWFFGKQASAASFIISLIDSAPENEVQPIADIIFYPLLISYSGSIKEYLEEIKQDSSDKVKQIITTLLAKLEKYHEGLMSTENVVELQPTQVQREAYSRYFAEMYKKHMPLTPKNSILNLISTIHILYGDRSIHFTKDGDNRTETRHETPFKKISTSLEPPSLEYLDPHKLTHTLHIYRIEGCKS